MRTSPKRSRAQRGDLESPAEPSVLASVAWSHRLAVRMPGSQPGDEGSTPSGTTLVWLAERKANMGLLILLLLLLLLFGGLGITIHFLWFIALVVIILL